MYVLLAVLCAYSSAEEIITAPPTSGPRPSDARKRPFYFITDYLPAALYEGDSVTACFRIENTTATAVRMKCAVTSADLDGKTLPVKSESVDVPANGFAPWQTTLDPRYVSSVSYTLSGEKDDATVFGELKLRLVRAKDSWTGARIQNGKLTDSGGTVLIPLSPKRLKPENRALAPLKWLLGPAKTQSGPKLKSAAFLPGRWFGEKSLSGEGSEAQKRDFVALGPYAANGAAPIIAAMNEVLGNLQSATGNESERPRRVVLCLPPEDLDFETDPRLYRTALDVMLSRFETQGMQQVLIVPPFQYGAGTAYCARLRHEVYDAAATYLAQVGEVSDYLEEKLWRVDPREPGAYGIRPNAEGLKKIQKSLLDPD